MHGRACTLLSSTSTLCQDSEYVVAVRNFINEDRTLLNFHKGDIIRLQHVDGLEAGENQRNSCAFCICEPYSVWLVPAALLLTWCASLWLRQTLRLHSEKESHASGGTEEGHFWVWWVWQGCSGCVCLSVLSNKLLWHIACYFHFFVLLFSDVCFCDRFSLQMLVLRWLPLVLVESRLALRGCLWQIGSLPQWVRPSGGSPGLPGSPAWPRGASGQTRASGCICGHRCGHGVLHSRPWARPFHRGDASKALFLASTWDGETINDWVKL